MTPPSPAPTIKTVGRCSFVVVVAMLCYFVDGRRSRKVKGWRVRSEGWGNEMKERKVENKEAQRPFIFYAFYLLLLGKCSCLLVRFLCIVPLISSWLLDTIVQTWSTRQPALDPCLGFFALMAIFQYPRSTPLLFVWPYFFFIMIFFQDSSSYLLLTHGEPRCPCILCVHSFIDIAIGVFLLFTDRVWDLTHFAFS